MRKKGGERSANGRKVLGVWGEEHAARFLVSRGYRIYARNFFARVGEIDIIAEKEGIIYCGEVKTRRGTAHPGYEAVTPGKRRRMRAAFGVWAATQSATHPAAQEIRGYQFLTISVRVDTSARRVFISLFEG